jgi:CBS domain-containing protein
MATDADRDIVSCPRCGADNTRGSDSCEHCQSDLTAFDKTHSEDLDMVLGSIRCSRATTIPSSATLGEAIAAVSADVTGAVLVIEADRIAGVFTERDILGKAAGPGAPLDAPVTRFMTPDPVVLREDDTIAMALNKMGNGGFRHIPLVRDGKAIGMVTSRDVLQWLMSCYFDPA